MACVGEDSLESILNRATNPSLREENWEDILLFAEQVKTELEGSQIAVRLLAHKVQSPQENEALYALLALESCVKNCGRIFHQEIGKFRFLNEMIKVVSPKYLGQYTAEKVKKRCIELLFSWSINLKHEPKIQEAYTMLKKQGIVTQDPDYVDKNFEPPLPTREDGLFEDEEKSKLLARLLKSKHPEDLQAANRLIKNVVKAESERMEKLSRRQQELETIDNNVKLLNEMLSHYRLETSSDGERDLMKELYDNLEKTRPNLFRLASDTDEKDTTGMDEILQVSDCVIKSMLTYKKIVEGKAEENGISMITDPNITSKQNSLVDMKSQKDELLDLFHSTQSPEANNSLNPQADLLDPFDPFISHATNTNIIETIPNFSSSNVSHSSAFTMSQLPVYDHSSNDSSLLCDVLSENNSQSHINLPEVEKSSKHGLDALDILGNSLKEFNLTSESKSSYSSSGKKLSMNQMLVEVTPTLKSVNVESIPVASNNNLDLLFSSSPISVTPAMPVHTSLSSTSSVTESLISSSPNNSPSVEEVIPLTNVMVKIDRIDPDSSPPITLYDQNNLKTLLCFAKNRPRPDVYVMVISTLSLNPNPVTGFVLQTAVPKSMKVKLQPPSSTELPSYNPILPPTAVTQIMLIANPQKEKIRLRFRISFRLKDELISDSGEIDNVLDNFSL